jgi:hypothetical protein
MQCVAANAAQFTLAYHNRGLRYAPPPATHMVPLRGAGGDGARCNDGNAPDSPGCIPLCASMNGLGDAERAGRRESSDKPRSGATRIAGGEAERNPRSRAETKESRVAATRSRPSGYCDAATRHGSHIIDSGGSASLHPRLFTSCRSAAPVAMALDAMTGLDRIARSPVDGVDRDQRRAQTRPTCVWSHPR